MGGRLARLLLLLALLAMGCTTQHKFTLSDVATPELGKSSRAHVEAVLGKPSLIAGNTALYETRARVATPRLPPSLLSRPFFISARWEEFAYLTHYDAQVLLAEASLTVGRNGRMSILLFRNFHYMPVDGFLRKWRPQLRQIEANGTGVWYRFRTSKGPSLGVIHDGKLAPFDLAANEGKR